MKTAVIQINAGSNKERNIKKAVTFVRRAAQNNAKFILLPEAFNFRGKVNAQKGHKGIAENFPGPSTRPLMEAAKELRVFILAGSICERIAHKKKSFNTSVLIDAHGQIAANYRKIHLFDAVIGKIKLKESQHFCHGRKTVLLKVGPWTMGLSICYDLRFPELYQEYAQAGANVLCVPSAFTKTTGVAHWEVLLRARAIENLCYVLAPNQIGKDGHGVFNYGNSMIIDPWGKILAKASGNKEEIIYAHLDKKYLKKRREILPGQGRKK